MGRAGAIAQTPSESYRGTSAITQTPSERYTGPAESIRRQGGSIQGRIGDAARYTAQTLFGGWDVRTGTYFTGAYDSEGNLVNPELVPNMLSPEVGNAIGLTEEDRIALGYNPEWPYELQEVTSYSGGGGGGGGGRGYRRGGGGGYVTRPQAWGLHHWRY